MSLGTSIFGFSTVSVRFQLVASWWRIGSGSNHWVRDHCTSLHGSLRHTNSQRYQSEHHGWYKPVCPRNSQESRDCQHTAVRVPSGGLRAPPLATPPTPPRAVVVLLCLPLPELTTAPSWVKFFNKRNRKTPSPSEARLAMLIENL